MAKPFATMTVSMGWCTLILEGLAKVQNLVGDIVLFLLWLVTISQHGYGEWVCSLVN